MDASSGAAASSFRVKRKPIGGGGGSQPLPEQGQTSSFEDQLSVQTSGLTISTAIKSENQDSGDIRPPPLPPRSRTTIPTEAESPGWAIKGSSSFGPYVASPSSLSNSSSPLHPRSQAGASSSSSSRATPTQPKLWQSALATTRDFALNLVPQNITSTKHYTILLHSSPLIVYRGPKTSITLTIFSSPSHPLPPPESRTLHLQPRGASGNTGARLKAFIGFTDSWIDVTPAQRVPSPTDVEPAVAQRWDRDIARAAKRLAKQAARGEAHVARETHVVRIPAAAQDGYFRVVVCHTTTEAGGGKKRHKVLCAGPVVRIASLSSDAAVFRGAKLRTLPLEAGIQVATTFASNTVGTVVGPVVETVQSKVQQFQPGLAATTAGQLAYGATLQDKVDAAGERADMAREEHYRAIDLADASARNGVDVIGPEDGPQKPFPIKFRGKVVRGTGKGTERLGIPTANLSDVPEDIKFRLKGVYFGWAKIVNTEGVESPSGDWHEAVISVGPSPYASPSVVAKTIVAVHLLHNFDETTFYDAKLQVIVMGFLRPMKGAGTPEEEMLDAISQDLWLTMSSLSRENWGPDGAVAKIKTLQSARSFSDKYVVAREKVQTSIDRIPAHLVGVRTAGAELRDQAFGNGGYWIAR